VILNTRAEDTCVRICLDTLCELCSHKETFSKVTQVGRVQIELKKIFGNCIKVASDEPKSKVVPWFAELLRHCPGICSVVSTAKLSSIVLGNKSIIHDKEEEEEPMLALRDSLVQGIFHVSPSLLLKAFSAHFKSRFSLKSSGRPGDTYVSSREDRYPGLENAPLSASQRSSRTSRKRPFEVATQNRGQQKAPKVRGTHLAASMAASSTSASALSTKDISENLSIPVEALCSVIYQAYESIASMLENGLTPVTTTSFTIRPLSTPYPGVPKEKKVTAEVVDMLRSIIPAFSELDDNHLKPQPFVSTKGSFFQQDYENCPREPYPLDEKTLAQCGPSWLLCYVMLAECLIQPPNGRSSDARPNLVSIIHTLLREDNHRRKNRPVHSAFVAFLGRFCPAATRMGIAKAMLHSQISALSDRIDTIFIDIKEPGSKERYCLSPEHEASLLNIQEVLSLFEEKMILECTPHTAAARAPHADCRESLMIGWLNAFDLWRSLYPVKDSLKNRDVCAKLKHMLVASVPPVYSLPAATLRLCHTMRSFQYVLIKDRSVDSTCHYHPHAKIRTRQVKEERKKEEENEEQLSFQSDQTSLLPHGQQDQRHSDLKQHQRQKLRIQEDRIEHFAHEIVELLQVLLRNVPTRRCHERDSSTQNGEFGVSNGFQENGIHTAIRVACKIAIEELLFFSRRDTLMEVEGESESKLSPKSKRRTKLKIRQELWLKVLDVCMKSHSEDVSGGEAIFIALTRELWRISRRRVRSYRLANLVSGWSMSSSGSIGAAGNSSGNAERIAKAGHIIGGGGGVPGSEDHGGSSVILLEDPSTAHDILCDSPAVIDIISMILNVKHFKLHLPCLKIIAAMLDGAKSFWIKPLPPPERQHASISGLQKLIDAISQADYIRAPLTHISALLVPLERAYSRTSSQKSSALAPKEMTAVILRISAALDFSRRILALMADMNSVNGEKISSISEAIKASGKLIRQETEERNANRIVLRRILIRRMPHAMKVWHKFFPPIE